VFEQHVKGAVDQLIAKAEERADWQLKQIDKKVRRCVAEAVKESNLEKLIDLGVQRRLETAASIGKIGKEERVVDLT
jgi:hypothetical protein